MLGGFPVVYTSAAMQLLVERQISVPYYYWVGIRRANDSSPFKAMFTEATVGPNVSNIGPYAHWWVLACLVGACMLA